MTDESNGSRRRPPPSIYRSIEDLELICALASLEARPMSIAMVISSDNGWTPAKISRATQEYMGRGAKHGRRPIVSIAGATRKEVMARTFAYCSYAICAPFSKSDAHAVIEAQARHRFMAQFWTDTTYPTERTIAFTQGLPKLGLRPIACRACAAPSLVDAHKLAHNYYCDPCTELRRAKQAAGETDAAAPVVNEPEEREQAPKAVAAKTTRE